MKEAEHFSKIQRTCDINTANVEGKTKSVTGATCNRFKNISENTWATYRESTKPKELRKTTVHCTQTAGNANVKVQNIFNMRYDMIYDMI